MNRTESSRGARNARPPAQLGAPDATPDLVPIGFSRRPHGVDGQVLVQALGDTLGTVHGGEPLVVRSARGSSADRTFTVRQIRPTHGDMYLLELVDICTREAARAVCGAELCVPRSRLPSLASGEFYRADLLGLAVVTESGTPLGVVHAFLDLPQQDVLVVREGSHEILLPMVEGWVRTIDLETKRIVAGKFVEEPGHASAPPRSARHDERAEQRSPRREA